MELLALPSNQASPDIISGKQLSLFFETASESLKDKNYEVGDSLLISHFAKQKLPISQNYLNNLKSLISSLSYPSDFEDSIPRQDLLATFLWISFQLSLGWEHLVQEFYFSRLNPEAGNFGFRTGIRCLSKALSLSKNDDRFTLEALKIIIGHSDFILLALETSEKKDINKILETLVEFLEFFRDLLCSISKSFKISGEVCDNLSKVSLTFSRFYNSLVGLVDNVSHFELDDENICRLVKCCHECAEHFVLVNPSLFPLFKSRVFLKFSMNAYGSSHSSKSENIKSYVTVITNLACRIPTIQKECLTLITSFIQEILFSLDDLSSLDIGPHVAYNFAKCLKAGIDHNGVSYGQAVIQSLCSDLFQLCDEDVDVKELFFSKLKRVLILEILAYLPEHIHESKVLQLAYTNIIRLNVSNEALLTPVVMKCLYKYSIYFKESSIASVNSLLQYLYSSNFETGEKAIHFIELLLNDLPASDVYKIPFALLRSFLKELKGLCSGQSKLAPSLKGLLHLLLLCMKKFKNADEIVKTEFENILTEIWIYVCLLGFSDANAFKIIIDSNVAENLPQLSPWILFNFETSNIMVVTNQMRVNIDNYLTSRGMISIARGNKLALSAILFGCECFSKHRLGDFFHCWRWSIIECKSDIESKSFQHLLAKLISQYVSDLSIIDANNSRKLVDLISVILIKSFSDEVVQSSCLDCIKLIFSAFPEMNWNHSVMNLLVGLLEAVFSVEEKFVIDCFPEILVDQELCIVIIPLNISFRKAIFSKFRDFFAEIIGSRTVTNAILLDITRNYQVRHPSSFSVVREYIEKNLKKTNSAALKISDESHFADMIGLRNLPSELYVSGQIYNDYWLEQYFGYSKDPLSLRYVFARSSLCSKRFKNGRLIKSDPSQNPISYRPSRSIPIDSPIESTFLLSLGREMVNFLPRLDATCCLIAFKSFYQSAKILNSDSSLTGTVLHALQISLNVFEYDEEISLLLLHHCLCWFFDWTIAVRDSGRTFNPEQMIIVNGNLKSILRIAQGLKDMIVRSPKLIDREKVQIFMPLLERCIESVLLHLDSWSSFLSEVPCNNHYSTFDENIAKLCILVNPRLFHTLFPSPLFSKQIQFINMVSEYFVDLKCDWEILKVVLPSIDENRLVLFSQQILYWDLSPIPCALSYMNRKFVDEVILRNYVFRVLDTGLNNSPLSYIPQIVQSLRYDNMGFIEEFILRAASLTPLFAHQVIWNIKANMYQDWQTMAQDPLFPTFERILNAIETRFSDADREFYLREFSFFEKVTSISGSLKPYVKKSKAEKKKKIDEELRKIKVDAGVYLPSNPESCVVDIDYNSGRPLQSHAKAPFLATFQVLDTGAALGRSWQSAIFKVGDDCRQDMLALQLIGIFKSAFESLQIPLYVFPYRVVATGPGSGVIEVIPNAMSRDQMGREKINSLSEYFKYRFGHEETIAHQKAKLNFIKSMAAYSIICYLLAIKDRHNGNIMIDDEGHLIHIDFGFILDIAPGGITFEVSPFKLTSDILKVIGGATKDPYFQLFQNLCSKAFLAARRFHRIIIDTVELMKDSGLPCFKGDSSIKKLETRFQLQRNEIQATTFVKGLIKNSYENKASSFYDFYQKQTNGIPY